MEEESKEVVLAGALLMSHGTCLISFYKNVYLCDIKYYIIYGSYHILYNIWILSKKKKFIMMYKK